MLLETSILCERFVRLAKERYGLILVFFSLPYIAYNFNKLRENLLEMDIFTME